MTSILLNNPTLATAMLTVVLPFLSLVVIMVFTRPHPRLSAAISLTAASISLFCAIYLLASQWHMQHPIQYTGKWLLSGTNLITFGFLLDQHSLLMLAIVAVISFLVQVYSLGYMAGDPGFSRYYAFQSLFAWAMLTLCISPTLLQLYIFWELVGLASYLLIGFWYEKFSASEAGKKAFVMTRFGDVAFFLGVLTVLFSLGDLNIVEMNSTMVAARMSPSVITLASLLIFGGIVGKSAQFPLLTWLPDAMEGPTPVSALLHSATMVAAGVYLFGRLFPFFSNSATAMSVFLAIGTITMLLASTMAMVTRDIKQVWAYSTISQLGFMVMGLAAGSYFAGTFHLTTHAGFKALLFLCSGVLIHEFETNDMYDIGTRGGRGLKIPIICMTIGAAALSGLPPLSGFFSKEAIMGALAGLHNPIWLVAGLAGAFLTAYYSFRLIFIILFPQKIEPVHHEVHEGHHDAHHHAEIYWVMAWPLIILAAITIGLGFFQAPLEHFLGGLYKVAGAHGGGHHAWLLYTAVGLALFGVVLAWFEFGRPGAAQIGFVERVPAVRDLFAERWYMDLFWRRFLDYVIYGVFSNLFTRNDRRVIDGGIDGICRATVGGGWLLSFLQSGMLQYNLMVMFAVLALVALYFFF
ncbi:MAG: NADH-quinone oxidoreductase subunit L [Deltaproteobacteria bacterium]|nr:NADH-quinone oxidoreductase subunit L [Deltaproteobacteria bacterium]MBW2071240.1 NADH-quinone oxidoreductase subunit L [Deltaproteobacteria bacterium]